MKRKIQLFNYTEFNNLLDRIDRVSIVKYGYRYEDRDPTKESLTCFSFCKFNPKNVEVTTKYGPEMVPCTYIFTRDHSTAHLKQGSEEYGIMMRAAKGCIPDLSKDEWCIKALGKKDGKFLTKNSGILMYNEDFNNKYIETCYQYDLNSAYLSVLYKKLPDTKTFYYNTTVKQNQVGFIITDSLILVDKPGLYADVVFDLIDTPEDLKKYCERWFYRCKDPNLKLNAKHQIVDSIGYLQYHNPFVRAYIIETCNNYMYNLKNKQTTVLLNTDAIYSTVPLDLDLGTNIGQFKLKIGDIKLDGLNYESEQFGDVHRGLQENNFYDVINNRLYPVEE